MMLNANGNGALLNNRSTEADQQRLDRQRGHIMVQKHNTNDKHTQHPHAGQHPATPASEQHGQETEKVVEQSTNQSVAAAQPATPAAAAVTGGGTIVLK